MRWSFLLLSLVSCGSDGGGSPDAASDAPAVDASADQQIADAAGDGALGTGTTIASNVQYPFCLAADATNVYYCSGPDVFMVPIAGGAPTKLATNPNAANDWSIAVGSNALYVLDASAGYIGQVPLPAGGWSWLEKSTVFAPGRGVVLAGSKLYWLAQLSGNVVQVDVTGGTPTNAATGQASPAEIVGDSNGLFWANQNNNQTGAIVGMPLPSGTPTPLTTAVAPRRIAADATNVYYIAAGGNSLLAVLEVPRAGGAAKEIFGASTGLATGQAPTAITANGGVYASTNYPTGIYKIGASGGVLVAKETSSVPEILADANNLYWVTGDQVNGAVIKKMPKP